MDNRATDTEINLINKNINLIETYYNKYIEAKKELEKFYPGLMEDKEAGEKLIMRARELLEIGKYRDVHFLL